ncbi:MAG: hypothetical protein JW748_00410 [Anaerolineales bacterium]|nr:hypothetical protein [Anaerolineales bacterium]
MKYLWILRIAGVIVLLAGIAAVGYFSYTAGVAQGQTAVPAVVETGDAVPARAGWGFLPMRGMMFFPALLCLAPLFLGFFICMPLRMIFGPHRMLMHMHGRGYDRGYGPDVPPPFAEWHRRMHEEKEEKV